ncbi:MFS transporter [Vibrio sp. S9_S30]|uniref:MFS transporter n=1 Tax=Vibrio sp. S9_S30 TaxID=2720226 RepID=UPI001EED747A|nr:MFS transporter [Vibrio sp. S9_S30]
MPHSSFTRPFQLIVWVQCVFFVTGILVFSIGIEIYEFKGISGYSFLYLLMLVPGLVLSKIIGRVIDKTPSFLVLITSLATLLTASIAVYFDGGLSVFYIFAFACSILSQIINISTSSAVSLATDDNKLAKIQGLQTAMNGLMYIGTPLIANSLLHYFDFNVLILSCGTAYTLLVLSSFLFRQDFNYTPRKSDDTSGKLPLNKLFFSILPLQLSYVIVLTYFNSYALSLSGVTESNTVFFMIGLGGFVGGILSYKLENMMNKTRLMVLACFLMIIAYTSSFFPYLVFIAPVALGIGYNLAFSVIRTEVKMKYREGMIATALGTFQYYMGMGSLIAYLIATLFPNVVASFYASVALFVGFLLFISIWLFRGDSNQHKRQSEIESHVTNSDF